MQHETQILPESLALSENRTTSLVLWVAGFATLTAAGAQLTIPTLPVPMTLQTPFVLLAGALLGARLGAWSQILYLAAGAAFLPVFAGGMGGLPYLLATPTIGYLVSFPLAAFVVGVLLHKRRPSFVRSALAMSVGMLVIFAFGMLGLVWFGFSWSVAFEQGFLGLQLWDVLKIATTALLATAVLRASRSA